MMQKSLSWRYWSPSSVVSVEETLPSPAPRDPRRLRLGSCVYGTMAVMVAAAIAAPGIGAGQDAPAKPKERMVQKEVTGEVVATTKRSLSLETSRTASHIEEMLLPVDPAVTKFERVLSVSDLQPGDRVRVEYRQTFRKGDTDEERLVGTVATKISLLGHSLGGPVLRSVEGDGS